MSIATAKSALREILLPITTTYGSGPVGLAKVYADPKEATSLGEFPAAIIALAPQVEHRIAQETAGAFGLARHEYALRVWLIVGARHTPINELVRRCEAWVEPIIAALMDNVTLNNTVTYIGNGVDTLATYEEQTIIWGLNENEAGYYGIVWTIPVTELIQTPVEP